MTPPTTEIPRSNLEYFVIHSTPNIRCQFMPKRCIWKSGNNKQMIKYFTLGDLWNRYEEWSIYGLGSPMHLDSGETVVQYFAPFLSAIEVYTHHPVASSDNGGGMLLSSRNDSSSKKAGNFGKLSNNCSSGNQLSKLYCQYIEDDIPYNREPLMDKINKLAHEYPGLKTFRSVDISPSSWMAVAWYPIYAIPRQRNSKMAFAAFITYHAISSLAQCNNSAFVGSDSYCNVVRKKEVKGKVDSSYMSLHPFGLATYKMQPKVWLNRETVNRQRIVSLLRGADSWLKQRQIKHEDYEHFKASSNQVLVIP